MDAYEHGNILNSQRVAFGEFLKKHGIASDFRSDWMHDCEFEAEMFKVFREILNRLNAVIPNIEFD